ncbi:hypothetical protein BKA69DRAFT_26602 [Paraphysoderma sedebokerense]|nr:hypothetical protein BKA69DRAFT_26602 [Paraphysoderma sedebokerense]
MQEPSVIAQCEQKYKSLNAIEVQLKQQRSPQEIDSLRQEYRDLCEDLTNLDIQFSVNRNIEDKLWRLVMYAKFEELRNRLKRSGTDENKTFLRRHLQQMDGFYNHRLRLLNVKLDISTGISMFVRSQSATSTDDDFRFKVISSHKCLVFLGDIGMLPSQSQSLDRASRVHIVLSSARYRQQYLMNDKSYISAAHFYYKAIQINPCNGKPYSQLAMISGYQDDYLSLVYWYCQRT